MISNSKYDIEIFQSTDFLNKAAAKFLIETAKVAVDTRGRFILSLSGGETPEKLYALLVHPPFRENLPWKNTYVFWGDERCVPLYDERNNAYQAITRLLDKINIPPAHIHRIPVNLPPVDAATTYEKGINDFFSQKPPRFDLMLLGLGENGHTASLFPGTAVIHDQRMGMRAVNISAEKTDRVTMTASLINESRNILFLVTGSPKAEILAKVLEGPYLPDQYPAQLIRPREGALYWFVDRAAAALVKNALF